MIIFLIIYLWRPVYSSKIKPDVSTAFLERAQREVPLGRFATVEEVADAALFLAANEYANNCVLNLDGGLSAV